MSSAPPARPPAATEHLKTNAFGATNIAFLVIAAAAPLTVMAGVAPLAVLIGGIGAPVGYLAAGVVLIIFAVGFMAMTKHTGGAGAFYSYITLGLGRRLGMASGILAVVSYNALQIGVYGLLGQQVHDAVERLAGIDCLGGSSFSSRFRSSGSSDGEESTSGEGAWRIADRRDVRSSRCWSSP